MRWDNIGTLICDEVPANALAVYYAPLAVDDDPLAILIAEDESVTTDFDIFAAA